jgi:predicted transcriptional regulator
MPIMKTLTKAEEQIMQALWQLQEGFIRDIIDILPIPKPHQNTVATLLKILTDKAFVGIKVMGRQHLYYPLISKEEYSKATMDTVVKRFFNNSFTEAVSFMVKDQSLSVEELEVLLQQLKKDKL